MKKKIIIFFFFQLIKISFSIVPLWNFELSSQNLITDNDNYFEGQIYGTQVGNYKLKIKVSKNENGMIKTEKTLYLDENEITGMDYDEIESVYKNNNNNYFVCPKGKFNVYFYNFNDPSKNKILQDGELEDKNNWDLKCFYQPNAKLLFISYLNSQNKYYEYILDEEKFKNSMKLYNGIFAFKWQLSPTSGSKIPMYAVIKSGQEFVIKYLFIDVQEGQSFGPDGDSGKTWKNIPLKLKYLAFFRNDESTCYFINYNDANDFQSGYSNKQLDINNFDEKDITINNDSPFKFVDKITINEIQFIYGTQYVYYNITNIDKGKFYYGIIDIKLNKIIFNTDEYFIEFKPFSSNAMYAKTKNSAYKICTISKGYTCLDKCSSDDDLIIDSMLYNNCGGQCSSLILEPDKICVDKCNENYLIKESNKCLLCKDKNKNYKFKLINFNESIDCLAKMPNNSEYINENFYLVACKEGFDLFEDNNCVKSCSNGHYEENQICKKCDINCQTCENTSNNCTSCKFGEYLDKIKFTCNNCSENCETCSNGEEDGVKNCLTCKKNTDFKYLYNKTCLVKCPNGTIVSKDECILEKKEQNSNEDKKEKKKKTLVTLFMVLTVILLLSIIIWFFKNVCYIPKKNDENIINEINTELENKESSD